MLDFDTLGGFWLLALVPLLWLLQRRKARPRRLLLPAFPVLEALLRLPQERPPLFLRLVRRLRHALNAAAIALLALAFNGTHLHLKRPEPREWLVVVDNPYTLGTAVKGRRVLEEVRAAVARFGGQLAASDRLRLLVTCPEPRLVRVPEDEALDEALAALAPSAVSADVATLLEQVDSVAGPRRLQGRIVLSPRSDLWREALARREHGPAYWIPPAATTVAGNAGITAFDLRLSPDREADYTLYFEVGWFGPRRDRIDASLEGAGRPPLRRTVRLGPDGRGREIWRDLRLSAGPLTLTLMGADALPDDDRVAATVGAPQRVTVVPHGPLPLFLRQALESYEGFQVAEIGASPPARAVDVFSGDGPQSLTRPTLVVGPSKDFLGFRYRRLVEQPREATFHPTHPLTRALRFASFRPTRLVEFSLPPGVSPLAVSDGTPVIAAGATLGEGSQRIALWSFEPADRGLFLDPSFPILARETVHWLAGQGDAEWGSGQAGGNLLDADATAQGASITLPDARDLRYQPPAVRRGAAVDLTGYLLAGTLPLLLLAAVGASVVSEGR